MTFREAVAQRIRYVRLPDWTAGTKLELHITADNHVGPWVRLHDPYSTSEGMTPLLITALLNDPETRYEPVEETPAERAQS